VPFFLFYFEKKLFLVSPSDRQYLKKKEKPKKENANQDLL